jgi:hypothetical protein
VVLACKETKTKDYNCVADPQLLRTVNDFSEDIKNVHLRISKRFSTKIKIFINMKTIGGSRKNYQLPQSEFLL